ncbi:MAG: nucleoside-diphosphate sugar epimerase/dehydratase [Acholeplasma sp.]|nr:nucleoside-diphosphate sugar epimerase/dehydratase [Acholeplasma sp.]
MKLKKAFSGITYMVLDAVFISLSYVLSALIVKTIGKGVISSEFDFANLPYVVMVIVLLKILIYYAIGIYHIILKYLSFKDISKIVLATVLTNVLIVIVLFIQQARGVPLFMSKSIYVFITTFEVVMLVGYRLFDRLSVYLSKNNKKSPNAKRTLIIGAGSAGELALKEIIQNKDLNNIVVGFLDDDTKKIGRKICDIEVLGQIEEIESIIENNEIEEIVMAINDYPKTKLTELLNEVSKYEGVNIKRISTVNDVSKEQEFKIIDVKVEDLLERKVIKLETDDIKKFIKDEVILVTGGGGSIGSELCRQIFELNPKKLIVFDIYENNAYNIQMELERKKFKDKKIKVELVVLIGSVYNKHRLEEVFKEHQPTIVFHAAAYKHVPLMENSPVEAIRTNVLGTNNTADLANKYNVKKMVLVSSDKAVRPTNVMGATKRFAELIVGYHNGKNNTKFSSVRFGNVLGSNGSVIPLFKQQIADGGPITVTHKEITRYFMTIPEAVGLILQSAVYANGGEIFILDMGEPVKIYDLAQKMIRLAGLKPNIDIDIEIVGLRPGEKLYEELLVNHNTDNHLETNHSRIFIEKQENVGVEKLDLDYVINHYEEFDNAHIKKMIAHVITSYQTSEKENE